MYGINKRKVDQGVLAKIRRMDCVCRLSDGCQGKIQAHHVRSRGAGGDDSLENCAPLCIKHHALWHSMGVSSFVRKYDFMYDWLLEHKGQNYLDRVLGKLSC